MQVLGIWGTDSAADEISDLVERITAAIADEERIGIVHATPSSELEVVDGVRSGAVRRIYDVDRHGSWVGRGSEKSVTSILDEMATECTYAVVTGRRDLRYPTVVLGATEELSEEDLPPNVIDRVRSPEEVNPDDLLDRLDQSESHETIESLVSRLRRSDEQQFAGAIATFTGRVREKDSPTDPETKYLEFERYDPVAEQRMTEIEGHLLDREGVYGVEMYHRTGVVYGGEDIVHVAVLAGHRSQAFDSVRDGIDRLKSEVPFFKKEVTVEDEFWVHERE